MIKRAHAHAGSGFWLQWALANVAGWTAGSLLQLAVRSSVPRDLRETAVVIAAHSAVWGLAAGLLQWLVLRRVLGGTDRWAPASVAGWAVAGAVSGSLIGALGEQSGLVHIIGTGLLTGLLQWLVLRRQVQRAGWWVPASTVLVPAGLFAGAATIYGGLGVDPSLDPVPAFSAVFGIAGGAAFGVTSGAVLAWLLRHPVAPGIPTPVGVGPIAPAAGAAPA